MTGKIRCTEAGTGHNQIELVARSMADTGRSCEVGRYGN